MSWRHLLAWPPAHFIALGALLFAVQHLRDEGLRREPIRLAAAEVSQVRNQWLRKTGRAPTDEELQASLRFRIDEEVLLREALRLHLDTTDPVARARLLQNMRFAFDAAGDDDALLGEARRLGMSEHDVVVRRRMVQLMERRLVGAVQLSSAEVRAFAGQHPERYAARVRSSFRQLYFGDEQRARNALARLQSGEEQIQGEPFLLGTRFEQLAPAEIESRFGRELAGAVGAAAVGTWIGPLRSAYGLHLVQVHRRDSVQAPDLGRVGRQAAYALFAEREQQALQDALDGLRHRYRVELPAAGIEG